MFSSSNSLNHEFMSSKSRTQWDERKKKETASWICYMKSRKPAWQSEHILPIQDSVKTSTEVPTSRTKAGGFSCTEGLASAQNWGLQLRNNTCLTKSFWVLLESPSLAKQNWRGTAEGKALFENPEVPLCAKRHCQESRLGQEAFLGGRGHCLRCR